MNPKHIIIHHSAIKQDGTKQLERINSAHKSRGFPLSSLGYSVGYHCIIEEDGSAKWTRKPTEIGAHCAAKGRNFDSIGVCLAGDFTTDTITEEQRERLKETIYRLMEQHHIRLESVHPHRYWAATACYGKNLPDNIFELFYEELPGISDWALPYVEYSRRFGIEQWENGSHLEIVGTMNEAWMEHKLGDLDYVYDTDKKAYVPISSEVKNGGITKEQRITIKGRNLGWEVQS